MKYVIAALTGLFLIAGCSFSAGVSKLESARLLFNGDPMCTVFKIDKQDFLTAKHCIENFNGDFDIAFEDQTVDVMFTITPGGSKKNGREYDWALLHTTEDIKGLKQYTLGCNDKVYRGLPIATVGYPASSEMTLALGYVSSVSPVNINGANGDFTVDVPAAGGASGSPIINRVTGNVIGVLIEMYAGAGGSYAIGVQAIDVCN